MLIVYSIKVALCLIVFTTVYGLLLRRTTLHGLNRSVLLVIMVAAMVLPMMKVGVAQPSAVSQGLVVIEGLFATVGTAEPHHTETTGNGWVQALYLIYIIGMVSMVLRLIWQLCSVGFVIKRSHRATEGLPMGFDDSRVRVFVAPEGIASFSWFQFVVISAIDWRNNRQEVLTHELEHVRRWHSADILLCDALSVFQWYNPAIWLLRRMLREVHEYEADRHVLYEGFDSRAYQLLLIRRAVGDGAFALANNFHQKSLKNRIRMMKRNSTNPWQSLRALALLPVGALALMAFAHPSVNNLETTTTIQVVVTDTLQSGKTYDVVEQMPEFPGGIQAMINWMGENMSYPQSCIDQHIEGRVVVSFIVDKTGQVRDAVVVKSVAPELDAEALRVVSSMPNWTPGMQDGKPVNVKYAIPLSFKIPESDKQQTTE